MDLGLAGPTAPVLRWSSRVLPPIADRGVLHFWALTDLPAELLAISYPTTSRAFDSAPTMTLQQWEEWRQRRTCRVVMTAWSDDTTLAFWPACLVTSDIKEWLKVTIPACYQAIRQAWWLHKVMLAAAQSCECFFFHEYGRRVGMVPRSSLKERKYSQMVEKRTKTTQQQTKQNQPQPTGRDSTIK